MKTEYQYIHFVQLPAQGKTSRWSCANVRSHGEIGQVAWYGAWRQYCFFPQSETVYSVGCLQDIQDFIGHLMAERREILERVK